MKARLRVVHRVDLPDRQRRHDDRKHAHAAVRDPSTGWWSKRRRGRPGFGLFAWALAGSGFLGGCGGGCADAGDVAPAAEPAARVVKTSGRVERAQGPNAAWVDADVGSSLFVGDRLRTRADGDAEIALTAGGRATLGPDSLIELTADGAVIRFELGAVEVEGRGLQLETGSGRVAFSGGRARVERRDGALTLAVLEGHVELLDDAGERSVLEPGPAFVLVAGSAQAEVLEELPPPLGAAEARLQVQGAGVKLELSDGEVVVLPEGSTVRALGHGDRISVPKGSRVAVARGDQRVELVGPARWLAEDPEAATAGRLELGSGQVRTRSSGATLAVPGGVLLLLGDADVEAVAEVRVDDVGRAEVEVVAGSGRWQTERGDRELGPGDVVTATPRGHAPTIPGLGHPKEAALTLTWDRLLRVNGPPDGVPVEVQPPESCDRGAELRFHRGPRLVERRRVRTRTLVHLPVGATKVDARCLEEQGGPERQVAARTTARIYRDRHQPLPRVPPKTEVRADGRRYTVLYQSHLPELTFRWPTTKAGQYELVLETDGGERRLTAGPSPHVVLSSGELEEGTYRWRFDREGVGPPRQSQVSTLSIAFDNATPLARIRQPAPGDQVESDRVWLRGEVLAGAQVEAESQRLELRPGHRVESEIALPPDDHYLAVRVTHPRRGVHYFVRRLSRTSGPNTP